MGKSKRGVKKEGYKFPNEGAPICYSSFNEVGYDPLVEYINCIELEQGFSGSFIMVPGGV